MALTDLKTPTALKAVLRSVPSSARLDALRGANPALFGELERVSQNPRRSREFTVDTVEELILWLDDAEVINAIVAGDPREAVTKAAKSRLGDLNAPPPPSANARNINTRTQRALAKSTPLDALSALGQGNVDWALVGEWFVEQPLQIREELGIELAKLANHEASATEANNFVALLIQRSFTLQDAIYPQSFVHQAKNHLAGLKAIGTVTDVLTAPVAQYVVNGRFYAASVAATSVAPEAIKVLQNGLRYDVLTALEALPATQIAKEIAAADNQLSERAEALSNAKSATYVDELTKVLGTIDRAALPAASALAVPGISKESRAVLLRAATSTQIIEVFNHEMGDAPDADEVIEFAKAFSKGHVTSARDLISTMCRNHSGSTEPLMQLLFALWEHCPATLATVMNLSWHSNWVIDTCMATTASAFETHPDAWGVFFKAARQNNAVSAGDLIRAVVLTQE